MVTRLPAKALIGAGVAVLSLASLAGCGTSQQAGSAPLKPAAATQNVTPSASQNVQQVTLYVFRGEMGIKGPDGKGHDAFVPSSFVVKAGVPVKLTVINYDEGSHTITAPDLGLNLVVKPGHVQGSEVQPVATTFTFTLNQKGVYRWYCAVACDAGGGGWAMTSSYDGPDQDGFMAGHIVVI